MVSITFQNPQYLWFLFAIPFLIILHFFMLRHAKRKALKFANFAAIKRVTGERLITKNYTLLIIRILIVICAILSISQTTFWYEGKTNQNDYIIALDTSSSMTAADIDPTRLDAAKEYGQRFIDELDSNTRVGLVSFSGITFIEQPLTAKRDDLRKSLVEIESSASGTDIPGAIITSVNLLNDAHKGRAVILLTDGSNTIEDFNSRSIQRATTYANVNHVKIYTIGVGKDVRTPIGYLPQYYNVSATYNQDNLKLIANATGGRYYAAADQESLAAAYSDIKGDTRTGTVPIELTSYLMLSALLLIALEWLLINTRFRALP
jgi:Ca-activated chloride channel family protein